MAKNPKVRAVARPRPARPVRKAPRPAEPRALERQYTSALVSLSRAMVATVRAFLRAPLKAHEAGGRTDAREDFAVLDWGILQARLGRLATGTGGRLVDAHGKRLGRFSSDEIARILKIDPTQEPEAVRLLLEAWRRDNVALISSIAERLHDDVRAVVRESTREGSRVETLAKRLQERYAVSDSRAALIARDQTLKANSDLTRVRQAEAGVTRYVWSTSRDERVRPMHQVLEGRVFRWDDPPITNEAGDRNHPGTDYQCRCVPIPVLDD